MPVLDPSKPGTNGDGIVPVLDRRVADPTRRRFSGSCTLTSTAETRHCTIAIGARRSCLNLWADDVEQTLYHAIHLGLGQTAQFPAESLRGKRSYLADLDPGRFRKEILG